MVPPAQTRVLAGKVVMMPPYVGITRIRFMGSSTGQFSAPDPLSESATPNFEMKSDAERTAAAATTGGIRVVEFESGAVEAVDVVHFGSIHVQDAGLVDEDLQTFEFKYGVNLIIKRLVETHAIGKTGATAADHLD